MANSSLMCFIGLVAALETDDSTFDIGDKLMWWSTCYVQGMNTVILSIGNYKYPHTLLF